MVGFARFTAQIRRTNPKKVGIIIAQLNRVLDAHKLSFLPLCEVTLA